MIKKILVLLVTIMMIFSLVSVVSAEQTPGNMILQGEYMLDGDIHWKTLAGTDTTGGQRASLIEGQGTVASTRSIDQRIGEINVDEEIIVETSDKHPFDSMKVILAARANFDGDGETTQLYGSYVSPHQGEVAHIIEQTRMTQEIDDDDFNYIDTFTVNYEVDLTDGEFRRYIDVSGEISETYINDYIDVDGMVSIREAFELYDVQFPVEAAQMWFDLF